MTFNLEICKKYFSGHEEPVLESIQFTLSQGEILCLYGPSGCGKSTILRIGAGLDTDYEGMVHMDGKRILHPTRSIGMVVQTQVCFEWLTVLDNIAFGSRFIKSKKTNRRENRQKAREYAKIVGLQEADLFKYPSNLSGGMKQRMAFARALLAEPKLLMLDEPFSALDFESRQALQNIVLQVRSELQTSIVCVSHDPDEVLFLADTIMVLGKDPCRTIQTLNPDLPDHGRESTQYTPEFQQAKQELRALLSK